jgi:hypothetical protein
MGDATLGDVSGDFPVIGVDTLYMASTAKRFQTPDMGTDESVRVAVTAFDDVPRGFQMLARPVDAAIGLRHGVDIEVGGLWLGLGWDGIDRDDMKSRVGSLVPYRKSCPMVFCISAPSASPKTVGSAFLMPRGFLNR